MNTLRRDETQNALDTSSRQLSRSVLAALLLALVIELAARLLSEYVFSEFLSITALMLLCATACYLIFRLPQRPLLKFIIVTGSCFMIASEVLNFTEDHNYFNGWPLLGTGMHGHDAVEGVLLLTGVLLTLLVCFQALIAAVASEQSLAQEKRALAEEVEEHKKTESALERSREELRGLSMHLEEVREDERTRIAREVHDELGQTLTLLKMDLSTLELELRRRGVPDMETMLAGMQHTLAETMQSVRRIISELRPGLLDDLGLPAAVEWQCREFQRRTSISCETKIERWQPRLAEDKATAIFRILQEALTNVAKHANASAVEIELRKDGEYVELSVRDNGTGISVADQEKRESFGLRGIRERARQFGGTVEAQSTGEQGTTLRVRLPL